MSLHERLAWDRVKLACRLRSAAAHAQILAQADMPVTRSKHPGIAH